MSWRSTVALVSCAHAAGCAPPLAWPTAPTTIEYARGGLYAFVLDAASDELAVIELVGDTARAIAARPVRIDPIASNGLAAIVVDPARRSLFVSVAPPIPPHPPGPHSTHVLVPQEGALIALSLDTLRERARARTEPFSQTLSQSADRSSLWVASFEYLRALDVRIPQEERGGAVTVFDADSLATLAQGRPCLVPAAIAEEATADRAWIACFGEDALASVQRRGAAITTQQRFAVGSPAGRYPAIRFAPQHVALDLSRGRAWVANHDTRELVALALADGAPIARVSLEGRPTQPLIDAEGLLVATFEPGSVVRVEGDRATSRIALDESVCVQPRAITRSPDRRVFVLCGGDERRAGALLELSSNATSVLRRFAIGQRPSAVAFYQP
jgi:hypothetical protein